MSTLISTAWSSGAPSTMFLVAACGALVVAGLIGMVYALTPTPVDDEARPARTTVLGFLGRPVAGWLDGLPRHTRALIGVGAAAGVVVAVVTGWVIAIVLVPAAIVGIPLLLTPPPAAASIGKLEALEEWTRSLSGKLTAGQSLRSALIKSLQSAPIPIEREVSLMVSRLWNNTATTEQVLRAFAEDLNDSTGDVVASQLILAASGRGQAGLAKALDALAETVAADVRARRQIAADQAKPRTTARTVTAITLAVIGLLAFTGDYIEPYGTPLGQLLLAALLGTYVATLLWMRRMAIARPLPRFLDLTTRTRNASRTQDTGRSAAGSGRGRTRFATSASATSAVDTRHVGARR